MRQLLAQRDVEGLRDPRGGGQQGRQQGLLLPAFPSRRCPYDKPGIPTRTRRPQTIRKCKVCASFLCFSIVRPSGSKRPACQAAGRRVLLRRGSALHRSGTTPAGSRSSRA